MIGLIFPPSLLASTVMGGAIASVVARFHDKGFQTSDLHGMGESLGKGESAVVFIGDKTTEAALSTELASAKKVDKQPAPDQAKAEIDAAKADADTDAVQAACSAGDAAPASDTSSDS